MAIPNESDKWVLTPEEYAVPDGEGWKRYVYVRDVQGNIRAVVGENNAVAEQTDYYPYRMPMADVNSASAQPFKFGGKELEREGGMDFYDFEARRLDFALGRFTSPDPLCEQTPEVSPYAYCAADPVNFIDPTGMTIEYGDSVTDEQRNMLEQYRQEMSKSLLFKMIYDFLNSEEAGIFTINFGNIESPGQFVEGDIIYRKNSHGTNLYYMVFVEEIIHAFQYAHGQMDDPSINKEYEARLLTMWVLGEAETLAPSVEGCLGKYLDQIYSGRLVGIGNPELLRTEYQEYGKMFVDHFKRTYPTDTNYHVPANEPSRLFISIFQFLFNKILKTCRY